MFLAAGQQFANCKKTKNHVIDSRELGVTDKLMPRFVNG